MGVRRGSKRRQVGATGLMRARRAPVYMQVLTALLFAGFAQAVDSDADTLEDDWETTHFGSLGATAAGDPDGDGLKNGEEQLLGSNPRRFDTDGDALSDKNERDRRTNPTRFDTDGDGLGDYGEVMLYGTDPRRRDTDAGGRDDGEEILVDRTDPLLATDDVLDSDGDGLTNAVEARLGTDPYSTDSDGDLIGDAEENADGDDRYTGDRNENGRFEPDLGEETDPTRLDTDSDGLDDGRERVFGTDPFMDDSDEDGLSDGSEYIERNGTVRRCLHPALFDSDFDGIGDGAEVEAGLNPCDADSDDDGVLDGVEVAEGSDPNSGEGSRTDTDGDGLSDTYETDVAGTDPTVDDSDGDGLSDAEEVFELRDHYISDPLDADSDDDGILDGNEGGVRLGNTPFGGTSPLDADSDDDGLSDGQENGLAAPELSALDADATDPSVFVPDGDPASTTDPLLSDTDEDGLSDGEEDANLDGVRQGSETDPNLEDTDDDDMPDGWEVLYSPTGSCPFGTTQFLDPVDPADAALDIDADGLGSLAEYQLSVRIGIVLRRSRTVPCDADTDDDGVLDGAEALSSFQQGQSDPNNPDTDGDGMSDGDEDLDKDGRLALVLETDPTDVDTDGDGLADDVEDANGDGVLDAGETDPRSPDTDGDDLLDGIEALGFGTDPLNVDTDGDGLGDGLEVGRAGDLDPPSITDPRNPDTDGDGLSDGDEDQNLDGAWDVGETSPLDVDSDDGGVADGTEVLQDGTDPNDPSDDVLPPGEMPPMEPTNPPPGEGPGELDPRWTLEPNAEIRGSSCALGPTRAAPGAGTAALLGLGLTGAACVGRRVRRRRRAGAGAVSALALVSATPNAANAQVQPTPAQVANARNTNLDVNPHRINPAGTDLLGTSRPRVLRHLSYRAAASFDYISSPAVVADRNTGETLRALVGDRGDATFGAAVGFYDRFQVSLAVPMVLHQDAELPGQNLRTATASGFGSPTVIPRGVLVGGSGAPFSLGVEVPVTLPLWDAPAYMGYDGWGVEPRLLAEVKAGPLVFSTALGALFKRDQRVFTLHDGDQYTYALAALLPDAVRGWDFGAEYHGATLLEEPGRSAETRGEVLLGARHRIGERFSITAGGGVGVQSGIAQSSYRAFIALGYTGGSVDAPSDAVPLGAPSKAACGKPGMPPCPPPDTDQDGIADAQDACPAAAEDRDAFEDHDGCPEPDNDGDAIADALDGCPLEAEDEDNFKDTDGCPEPDNDHDTVLDAADHCPLEPEDKDGDADDDGCPDGVAKQCPDGAQPTATGECLARLEAGLITISEPIQFFADTAGFSERSREMLDQVVDILDSNPALHVLIVGHTDAIGSRKKNQELSELRANAVRWYLIRQSKNPTQMARRLKAEGRGESQPIDANDSAVGRSRNRRVEFLLIDPAKKAPAPPAP